MDAFALSISYAINKINLKTSIITSVFVGIFHFFMPLLGNIVGISLFEYTVIKPKLILFFVFLILSIDMIINFFSSEIKIRKLNIIGILFFAFSVSFDSFSIGLGISYIYDNLLVSVFFFCIISFIFTLSGFILGKVITKKIGNYSFLLGGITLFVYSLWVLTK